MSEASVQELINYIEVSDHLGCAGQPDASQLRAVQAAGYELVINLAMPASPEALADEDQLVRALGMEYISIPVVWEAPRLEDLRAFFAAMQAAGPRKVFVHCVLNMRVTAFLYLYLALVRREPAEAARRWMDQVWEPNETWQEFIQNAFAHYNTR